MNIDGADKYWIRTSITGDGTVVHVLAVMTALKLHPGEPGYQPDKARRFLDDLRAYKSANGFAAVEILQSGQ